MKARSSPLIPTGVPGGNPWPGQLLESPRGRPSPTSPVMSIAALPERRGARQRRALGQRGPVAGQDRRPLGEADPALELLAAPQAGEDEARVPVDAAVGEGQGQLVGDPAEGDRPDLQRHPHDGPVAFAGGVGRLARVQGAGRRRRLRFEVGLGQAADGDLARGGRIQLGVHGGEVAADEARDEAAGGLLLGRGVGTGRRSGHEGDDGHHRQGDGASGESATPHSGGGETIHGNGKGND